MSTQQDIYAAGSENRPPMLNKDNYVPWSSRLFAESTHEQTDNELTDKEEKKDKLFNKWENFNCTEGESIESYYHHFTKLMNDFSRNKHFPEKIANNLKILNNLQPEWKRYVTTVHQKKDLYDVDYNQLYDFLKMHQEEVNEVDFTTRADYRESERFNAVKNSGNQNANQNGNVNVMAARAEGNGNGNNGNHKSDIKKIEEFNANCILMANLQQASTSGTQTNKAPIYDSDGSAEPTIGPYMVQQNDNSVISEDTSMEHSEGTIEQNPATIEETHAYFESLYNNLVTEVEKLNMVNRKIKEANAYLTTELARYNEQEKCFEFYHEKFDELENGYRMSVYQEQCLTKKINALHLSSAKQIRALNKEIANLNNQLSK
ncbi:hypothetical protein Tco_1047738 [Tanacetum coccineum]